MLIGRNGWTNEADADPIRDPRSSSGLRHRMALLLGVVVVVVYTPSSNNSSTTMRRSCLLLSLLLSCLASSTAALNRRRSLLAVRGGGLSLKKKAPAVTKKPTSPKPTTGGSATIPNEVFNLVKAIVGVGVLGLPAGIAAFGNAPSAVFPAIALIALIGILSGYGFATIGRVCALTQATSYREAWSQSVGSGTAWIPAWSTTLKTFLACLAFSMVLGDTFASLLGTVRTPTLLGVTVGVLLPLCWLKNLSSLAPFSLLGVVGMAYTALAMTVRYLDGSYSVPNGPLVMQVAEHLRPSFGSRGWQSVASPQALLLVSMLSTAYMAHFNAPKFYLELQNNTMPRYYTVVAWSFGISILLMGGMAGLGFLTFGGACRGLVLEHYASSDAWMALSKAAVAVSLVFSYPLAFQGCRDGVLDLCKIKPTNAVLNGTTIALLGVLTTLAILLKDVSFVLAISGATLGNLLTYVYPAIMLHCAVKDRSKARGSLTASYVSAVLGVVMGIVGAKLALDKL